MITVVNPKIETPIVLSCQKVSILIVENPCEYYRMVMQMMYALQGDPSDFSFWNNGLSVSPLKEGELMLNGFSFDFADKKIVALLYKRLQNNYQNGSLIVSFNEVNSKVGAFLQDLCDTVDFSLEYQELSLDDLLKACSVKPAKIYQSLLEKIICYIDIFTELKNVKFFVFVGLKDILSDEDLKNLYHHCELIKVALLLLESSKKRPLLKQEGAIIITDDLCEILENYNN